MKPRHPEKVKNKINPIKRKPEWIRSKIVDSKVFFETTPVGCPPNSPRPLI